MLKSCSRTHHAWLMALLLFLAPAALADEFSIAVFIPESTPFWDRVANFAGAAGADIEVEVTVHEGGGSRIKLMEAFETVAHGDDAPDGMIFPNFLQTAPHLIRTCEERHIPCVLYNSDLGSETRIMVGAPRERYDYWIAQLVPDDYGTGTRLTGALIQAAGEQSDPTSPLTMVGLSGYGADSPSSRRVKALQDMVEHKQQFQLAQIFYTDWGEEDAYRRTLGLLKRYPDVRVIWSANYRTTTGILRALQEQELVPGEDIWVNSWDIDHTAVEQVREGTLAATAGGHYVEGAWAVIVMADHLRGEELPRYERVIQTDQLVLTRDNLHLADVLLRVEAEPDMLKAIDFRQFSTALSGNKGADRFSLERALRSLDLDDPSAEHKEGP